MDSNFSTEANDQDNQPELTEEELEKRSKQITRRRKPTKTNNKDNPKTKVDDKNYATEKKPNLEALKLRM